jgi:hypothetical protein
MARRDLVDDDEYDVSLISYTNHKHSFTHFRPEEDYTTNFMYQETRNIDEYTI